MNDNYTIPAFAEPITSMPDTPTLTAAELKRRFQAPADEVREAHNALAEAHEALDTKVEGFVTETFAGAIHESMFDEELASKLNGKAEQTALDAETIVRSGADSMLNDRLATVEKALPLKCRVAVGSYNGTGDTSTNTSQQIDIGFTPKAVFAAGENGTYFHYQFRMAALTVTDAPAMVEGGIALQITENGFLACNYSRSGGTTTARMNMLGNTYHYIAIG